VKKLKFILTLWVIVSCSSINEINIGKNENKIYEVLIEKPLIIYSDLNGNGNNEKIIFSNLNPGNRDSILQIKIYENNKIRFIHNIPSRKYYLYNGEYYIQIIKYKSVFSKNICRDLIFIYAGCCPPELYILYCQPKQYTEGHEMIADEKYDVLDTRIQLEEFQG